jgi:hypothetical protein
LRRRPDCQTARSTIVQYWNKDAFKAAGLDPDKAPATWDDMIAFGKKLTKRDAAGQVSQWGLAIPSSGFPYWLFQALTTQNDAIVHHGKFRWPMSALGQKQTLELTRAMSALCQKRTHAPQQNEWLFGHDSITSSARVRIVGGTVRPIALAVLLLIRSSNFVGCSTGRSAGFAPLRILSMNAPARRYKIGTFGPAVNRPADRSQRLTIDNRCAECDLPAAHAPRTARQLLNQRFRAMR